MESFWDAGVLLVPYGSLVYGTHAEGSDSDYICLTPNREKDGKSYRSGNMDIQCYSFATFQEQLDAHEVHAVETYLFDSRVRSQLNWKLDLAKLRKKFAAKSSNSFVKAKKKMDVEGELRLGKKSLFHALRILNFGIQIARTKTVDFGAANGYWKEIEAMPETNWDHYKSKFQPEHNRLSTEFRKLAPKEG